MCCSLCKSSQKRKNDRGQWQPVHQRDSKKTELVMPNPPQQLCSCLIVWPCPAGGDHHTGEPGGQPNKLCLFIFLKKMDTQPPGILGHRFRWVRDTSESHLGFQMGRRSGVIASERRARFYNTMTAKELWDLLHPLPISVLQLSTFWCCFALAISMVS